MRIDILRQAMCLHVFACSLNGWQKAPDMREILTRVQANLAAFDAALPDFVANEKVVSKNLKGETVRQQRATESIFTCIKPAGGGAGALREIREVTAVDGKSVKKGQKVKGPFLFGGAVASTLWATFSPKTAVFHDYTFAGEETLGGKRAFVIAFATKDGQTGVALNRGGKRIVTKDTGRAFLDPETMQVLRLERRFVGLTDGELTLTVDYADVAIDGKTLSMPKTVVSVLSNVGTKTMSRRSYTAEYSDYRKFSVETGITYQ